MDEKTTVIKRGNGTKIYYLKNKIHREGGPAFIGADGYKEWRINGKYHRKDGPAIEHKDFLEWRYHDALHRTDGPARITSFVKSWYLFGKPYDQASWFGIILYSKIIQKSHHRIEFKDFKPVNICDRLEDYILSSEFKLKNYECKKLIITVEFSNED